MGLDREADLVTGPHNVLGIELNEYAAELARVTVWIGELQWRLAHGYEFKTNPVLEPLQHIECRDALLSFADTAPSATGTGGGASTTVRAEPVEAPWPKASVVIGNPPFLGDKKMRSELGDAYTTTLRKTYEGRVPGGADLVCYWFDKARAAIESLAENASDGVVAPVFWFAVLGLPGLVAYKAINTADSMIGYRTARHEHFGWAAARLDDLVNLPASRLTGLLFSAAAALLPGGTPKEAITVMWRDASKHRSPNAGWPESAMAGALGLQLNGPRRYGGVPSTDAYMGYGSPDATAQDIARALTLAGIAWTVMFAVVLASCIIAQS